MNEDIVSKVVRGEQAWTPTYLYGGRDRGHSWLATFTFTWEPRQPRRRGARLPAPDDVTSATSPYSLYLFYSTADINFTFSLICDLVYT